MFNCLFKCVIVHSGNHHSRNKNSAYNPERQIACVTAVLCCTVDLWSHFGKFTRDKKVDSGGFATGEEGPDPRSLTGKSFEELRRASTVAQVARFVGNPV